MNTLIEEQYDSSWWPQAAVIEDFITKYHTPDLCKAKDLLGFDCLNVGLHEVLRVGEFLNIGTGNELLDIGCGIGGPARLISEAFNCCVHGIDIAAEQVRSARTLSRLVSNNNLQADFFRASALDLPVCDQTMDGVYAIGTFVHIVDKTALLNEAHRVLKPGKRLAILDYVRYQNVKALEETFPEHYHPFAPNELENLLARHGFTLTFFEDRSQALVEAYMAVGRVFSDKFYLRATLEAALWWLTGAEGLRDAARRLRGCGRFLMRRNHAVRELLGKNFDTITTYCQTQVQACKAGDIRYCLFVAEREIDHVTREK